LLLGVGQFSTFAGGLPHFDVLSFDPLTGALSPVPGSPFPAGRGTKYLAWTPSGEFLCNGNERDNTISCYQSTNRLEISKVASADSVRQGGVLRYTLTVHNPGVDVLQGPGG